MKKNTILGTLVLCLLLIFAGQQAIAQNTKIKGTVYNETNKPIQNATIKVKNSPLATVTDSAGNFTLTIPVSAKTLSVSYVGYETLDISTGTQTKINITLYPSDIKMQDVVITALGFESKKEKLGYATSKINGDQVANSGEANLTDALGGKASGVRVSRSSGSDPGAASQILIRGQSTITRSTDPLIVLDGVPIDGGSRGQGSGGTTNGSRLNDINPDDIASIQVLKGASAAALWGTRAANGVLMITTKKGAGAKTSVNFNSTYSMDQVNAKYATQTTYGQGLNGVWQSTAPRSWGDKIADRSDAADVVNTTGAYFVADNNGQTYYPITQKNSKQTFVDQNWDELFHNGYYGDKSISFSGGDNKSNYYFSVGDLTQQGVIRSHSGYERTNVRLNASKQVAKWLTISNKTSYTLTSSDRIQRGVNTAGFMIALLRTAPDFDDAGYTGKYFTAPNGAFTANRQRAYRNPVGANADPGFNNALWDIYQLSNTDKVNRFINGTELNAHPLEWLNITARAGLDYFNDNQKNFWPYNTATAPKGSYSIDNYSETLLNLDFIVRAEKTFSDNFSGNMLVGFNYSSNYNSDLSGTSLNLIIPNGPQSLNNFSPSTVSVNDSYSRSRTNAGYASAGIGLYKQLYINGTIRAEAASTFGAQSNSRFFYPSVDMAWQFTKLVPSINNRLLTFGKLRASFGIVGIQPSPYQTSNVFVAPTWTDQLLSTITSNLYGTGTYVQSSNKGNAQLRPEKKQEFEVGTDLRFFSDKLSASVTYYQNKTVDALLSIPQAYSTGFSSLYANAGSIQNKGFEVDLSYNVLKSKDWNLNVDVNWSANQNKVLSLNGTTSFGLNGTGISGVSSAIQGYALGELYGIGWKRDAANNMLLDANGFPMADNVSKPLGNPNPDWRGGIGARLRYKNLSFYALVEHSQGGVLFNATEAVMEDYGTSAAVGYESTAPTNLKTSTGTTIAAGTKFHGNIQDFGAGQVALDQNWYTGIGGYFGNVYEQFIKDNTWTRLREATLAYTIKSAGLSRKLGLSSLIVELSGRNLFVITKIKGIDPDTNLSGNSSGRGVTYFDNPGTRSYLATLKVNF